MIKWVTMAGVVGAGFAFAAGAFVGWKTTLKVLDSVERKVRRKDDATRS